MPGLISPHINLGLVGNPPAGSSNLILDSLGRLSLIRSDGSIELISGSSSTGATGSVGPTGSVGATGTSGYGIQLFDVTYNQLISGLAASSLTASHYRITDYQTVGYVLGSATGSSYSSDIEPLIVYASSGSCWPNALSEIHISDEILYDPLMSNWVDDKSFSSDGINIIDGFKGVIYNRKDTNKDISATYDWRNSMIRRWKMDQTGLTSWGSGTWSRGDFVEDSNNVIYYCMETHTTDGGSATGSYNPNMYYATSSTSDYLTHRNNIRYHWFRLFDKDLYMLPAWQGVTISSTYSLSLGTYPETASRGTSRTLDIPIDLNSYEDFNVFGIHGTTSVKTNMYNVSQNLSRNVSKTFFGSIVLPNRIESNKEIYNLEIEGGNLTIYDTIPILPPSDLSDNSRFSDNSFLDFTRVLVYGDSYTTDPNPETHPSWVFNTVINNNDLFGFCNLSNLKSNGLPSTFEESLLVKGSLILSCIRGSIALSIQSIIVLSYLQRVVNTSWQESQGDFIVGVRSSVFTRSIDNLFEIDLSGIEASSNLQIGPEFENNIIGIKGMTETSVGSNVSDNYLYGVKECKIGSNISGLTVSNPNQLRSTTIETDSLSDTDLSSSSTLFTDYTKVVYKRPDGTSRLRYYDDSDAIQIVNPTS